MYASTFVYLYILIQQNTRLTFLFSRIDFVQVEYIFAHLLKVHILVHWEGEGIVEEFPWINSVVDGAEPLGRTKPEIIGM